MQNRQLTEHAKQMVSSDQHHFIKQAIANSWSIIAPSWPLKNLIAANPIAGFEGLTFEEGLKQAKTYFQQQDMPEMMQRINRESIKWLQAFFDEEQSIIPMPQRHLGLLKSTLSLIRFDQQLHNNDTEKKCWLATLSHQPDNIVAEALLYLGIPHQEQEQFLILMLTTLPGWAAYIQYRTNWPDAQDEAHPHPVTQSDYLAFRLVLTCLLWPKANALLAWHRKAQHHSDVTGSCANIFASEASYQKRLFQRLKAVSQTKKSTMANAQLVFCIDVRSEPFRRALEAQGNYETYGFAGFFGLPVSIENAVTGDKHASCPVLLKPQHNIVEYPSCSHHACGGGHKRLQGIKKLYQSVKYTFTTPFSLAETMGLISGIRMGMKSLSPRGSASIKSTLKRAVASDYVLVPDIQTIPFEQQVTYAAEALTMMGLTEHFAPLIVFCGHGSTTQNNAYASTLDCGACGGHHSGSNAHILATILNTKKVREALSKQDLNIPENTLFLAAKHNTTTDEVDIYNDDNAEHHTMQIITLKHDLDIARKENSQWRSQEMGITTTINRAHKVTTSRAKDWAQVRPEWGLVRNAAFIVGPRWLTKTINLEGQSFLHSYEWEKDPDGTSLTTILTAPMIVAQWINMQYLFSTIDNVSYGSGSKVTQNITGKIGVMQGNASDLMTGLPLQSVYRNDVEPYHEPQRLMTVVLAPRHMLDNIIQEQPILKKLFGNGWAQITAIEPHDRKIYLLNRDFSWKEIN